MFHLQGHVVKKMSMSVFQAHARTVEDVLMGLIDITAGVLMVSLDSTVRPTLMNACQHLVYMGGTGFFLPYHLSQENGKLCMNSMVLFLIRPLVNTE